MNRSPEDQFNGLDVVALRDELGAEVVWTNPRRR
jgi:hypothetical protein